MSFRCDRLFPIFGYINDIKKTETVNFPSSIIFQSSTLATCKDRSIQYFNTLGFNVVRLLREGIVPLTVVLADPGKPSVATIYGHISEILADSDEPLLTVFEDLPMGIISGQRTNQLKFRLAIAFLKIVLSGWKGNSVSIETAFIDVDYIEFEYTNVLYDTVLPGSVGIFLHGIKPDIGESLLTNFDSPGIEPGNYLSRWSSICFEWKEC